MDENQKYSGLETTDSPQMTTCKPTPIESIFWTKHVYDMWCESFKVNFVFVQELFI